MDTKVQKNLLYRNMYYWLFLSLMCFRLRTSLLNLVLQNNPPQ